ncbi:Zn-dependent hydrolase [Longibacter salinarum]|uniref:Zn-dependent hydrolase n=1 Tax=Longibacter salinarum TaxID=1850348 RepID=A0A2A8CYQ7_9BACT|nr:Zn-dependent hydrolase [Longibacter salinarum]PEN13744.1 Zn-dependent hydrolase [Longibacter salinarum]
MRLRYLLSLLFIPLIVLTGCETSDNTDESDAATDDATQNVSPSNLTAKYKQVPLEADLTNLSENQQRMIPLFIEAAQAMDEVFWEQAYGNRDSLLSTIDNADLRSFVEINYGPWDRLNGNQPFIQGVGPKPAGANFYPSEATRSEIEAAAESNPEILGLYTMVRRGENDSLRAIPYHEFFAAEMEQAALRLQDAAELAEDEGFARYLRLRADALTSGEYQESDMAWMDMKTNELDVVIGPIETYEDQMFGAKAAAETFVLAKDMEWSKRLDRYAELLPMLQRGLPVPEAYKKDTPGRNSDLGAYDVLYVSGDANAGAKTIAINLPNDEEVQQQKGSRRLQLKNAMRAKYDAILVPISETLIAEEQRQHISFDAFFSNTMFHEVAHGLGIKTVINAPDQTVREALKDQASPLEEGKADVLGLYMVRKLEQEGEIDTALMDNYVTFLAGIFRSIRFGTSSAHGTANLVRFNYFREHGAFTRDEETGTYTVNRDSMEAAVNSLSEKILRLQGDGDYEAVASFTEKYAQRPDFLDEDLQRVEDAGIPTDITYEQGPSLLDGVSENVSAAQ